MKVTKKTARIINIVMIVLVLLTIVSNVAFAATAGSSYLDPSTIKANNDGQLATKSQSIAGSILGVAQVIGISVAIIMLIALAIKYVSAAPNDKAEIKKHAVVYIAGAIVLFGASGLLGLIRTWVDGTINA